jgi:hypothetical protein
MVREVMIAIGYGDKPVLDLSGDRAAMRLIEACRPRVGVGAEVEFRALCAEIRDASNELGRRE